MSLDGLPGRRGFGLRVERVGQEARVRRFEICFGAPHGLSYAKTHVKPDWGKVAVDHRGYRIWASLERASA